MSLRKLSFTILSLFVVLHRFRGTFSVHVKGTFETHEFFKFVTRFGFQKTDMHNADRTTGYIYGNISLVPKPGEENLYKNQSLPPDSLINLAILPGDYFIDYYKEHRILPRSAACSIMFEKIQTIAYFFECNELGKEDFIRRVPCQDGGLCIDEDNKKNVLDKYQFTFRIRDLNQARFWFLSFSSCNRNLKTCKWNNVGDPYNSSNPLQSYTIAYDIWIVNGDPDYRNQNKFEYQYTYELHDIFEIYLISFIFLLMILPFIIYRVRVNFHYLYLQVMLYVVCELMCRILSIIHNIVFASNGHGIVAFDYLAQFLEAFDSSILVLILISIAKGWTVRSKRLKTNKHFFIIGFSLLLAVTISHMLSLEQIDPVFNTNPYETTAGYVELSVRFLWMAWFLFELKDTFNNLESVANNISSDLVNNNFQDNPDMQINEIDSEPDDGDDTGDYNARKNGQNYALLTDTTETRSEAVKRERLKTLQIFYLHYGACSMVWFIYLPCLIFITSFVTELYRIRLVLGIRYLVNFLTVLLLVYIMWAPSTPLNLPGKKNPNTGDIVSRYIFESESNEINENEEENDEAVLFTRSQ